MAVDVANLYKRYGELEHEVSYQQRKRQEEAEKAVSDLSKITETDITLLKEYVPELAIVVKYTVTDLLQNAHGEVATLQRVYNDLTHLLDGWLKHFEDALC